MRCTPNPNRQNQNTTDEIVSRTLDELAAALEAGNSAALTDYLQVMGRFHKYSWTNSLLIAAQRPAATQVAGFLCLASLRPACSQRRKRNRHSRTDPLETQSREKGDEPQDEDLAVSSRLVGFRSAYVFDIVQTDGQALPEFATVLGDPSQYLECLKVLVLSHAIVLDYDASLAPAKGVSRGGHITLLPNLTAAEEFCTLVHELAHEKLHRTDRRPETTKTIRETEAEPVSFVVCRAIGLDTNTAAAEYIHLYRGDRTTLARSLQFIQSTAAEILSALEANTQHRVVGNEVAESRYYVLRQMATTETAKQQTGEIHGRTFHVRR